MRAFSSTTLALAVLLGIATPATSYTPFDTRTECTHKRLTWDDFQGQPRKPGRWTPGFAAHIVTTVRLTRFGVETTQTADDEWIARAPTAEAYAVMDKMLSGAASVAKEAKVLAHEQLHFDLAEAEARRLTLALRELEGFGATQRSAEIDLRSRAEQAQRDTMAKLNELQALYDRETYHGTRKKQQKRWAEKITHWLLHPTEPIELPADESS